VLSGPQSYNGGMQFFHWASGCAILACLGLVQYKQSLPTNTDEEKKAVGNIMMLHKSFGLVVSGLYLPRLLNRLVATKPTPVGGVLASLNHWAMYGLVATLCFTGVGMGYQNGFGVPFFGVWKLEGRPDKN